MNIVEPMKQSGGKEIYNNKNIRILVKMGNKITTTTASIIFANRKLLTMLIKMILPKSRQDVKVMKVWIKTIS